MSRLQEALERYKQEERSKSSPKAPSISLFPVTRSERSQESPPPHLSYTQSQSVKISEDLLERHRILHQGSSPLYVESYKRLKTRVLHRLQENHWSVLGLFSPRSYEGTTLTAINLSVVLGMDKTLTVLLVDGNLRKPHLQEILGFPNSTSGLGEYLHQEVPLKVCLVHPNLGRLLVLPGGKPVSSSLELLTSPAMSDLVDEMKHRYDRRLIIFDLPALLESADSLAFCPTLDAALLIVEEGRTTKADVQESLQLLQGTVPVLGTVCNKIGRQTLTLKSAQRMVSPKEAEAGRNSSSVLKRIFMRTE